MRLTFCSLIACHLLARCNHLTLTLSLLARCNHLTDFGGVSLPSTPEELLAEFTELTFNTFTFDELVSSKE